MQPIIPETSLTVNIPVSVRNSGNEICNFSIKIKDTKYLDFNFAVTPDTQSISQIRLYARITRKIMIKITIVQLTESLSVKWVRYI